MAGKVFALLFSSLFCMMAMFIMIKKMRGKDLDF